MCQSDHFPLWTGFCDQIWTFSNKNRERLSFSKLVPFPSYWQPNRRNNRPTDGQTGCLFCRKFTNKSVCRCLCMSCVYVCLCVCWEIKTFARDTIALGIRMCKYVFVCVCVCVCVCACQNVHQPDPSVGWLADKLTHGQGLEATSGWPV